MKRKESNWEREFRSSYLLAKIFTGALILFSVTVMGILVKCAINDGVLKEFLIALFLACSCVSSAFFLVAFTIKGLIKNHKNNLGIVETSFNTLAVRIYSGVRKISTGYTYKKLSFFLKDLFERNYQYLGFENQNDLTLCKDRKPKYTVKKGHVFYRISFHVPSNFKAMPKFENKIHSVIISDQRKYGVDGLFSYYDDMNRNRLDAIQLIQCVWDAENALINVDLLFVSSEHDARYIRQMRDEELQNCNWDNWDEVQ